MKASKKILLFGAFVVLWQGCKQDWAANAYPIAYGLLLGLYIAMIAITIGEHYGD